MCCILDVGWVVLVSLGWERSTFSATNKMGIITSLDPDNMFRFEYSVPAIRPALVQIMGKMGGRVTPLCEMWVERVGSF